MRLTVSQYLARLPDRATNTFWGGCSIGRYLPDSWCAVSCFVALHAASVGPENETQPSGMKGGNWVEKAESRSQVGQNEPAGKKKG